MTVFILHFSLSHPPKKLTSTELAQIDLISYVVLTRESIVSEISMKDNYCKRNQHEGQRAAMFFFFSSFISPTQKPILIDLVFNLKLAYTIEIKELSNKPNSALSTGSWSSY